MIVITINEFRDRHQSINSSKELPSMSHPSTQRPQEVSAAISDNSSLLPSRLSTLVDYVNHFIQNMTWSSEEIKLTYPDWYPGTARNIAEEALSISLLNGDPKDIKVSRANLVSNFLSTNMSHTHRHALSNETILSLLGMWEISSRSPEILSKALEMLDILFQLKLHPIRSDKFIMAQICEAKGENDEAETFYRQAIKSFTEIDRLFDDKPTEVQHRFGKFLMKINRDEEALLTMLNVYTDWLLKNWPPIDIEESRFQNSCSSECEKILESLQALHVKMDQYGTFARVRASVSQLQNIHQGTNSIALGELWLELNNLGTAYSEKRMFDAANVVFRFATSVSNNLINYNY
jgi:tetratricopeptide (TPR) repeat protein